MKIKGHIAAFLSVLFFTVLPTGGLFATEQFPPQMQREHFAKGIQALKKGDLRFAAYNFRLIVKQTPNSTIGKETFYHLGRLYFIEGEYEAANKAFSTYLTVQDSPDYFRKAIEFKYKIAEKFREGEGRHLFGARQLPKWGPGQEVAVEIYDEIIAAMPNDAFAVCALFAKADLLLEWRDFDGSIQAYRRLIKIFPKDELAPKAYLRITQVYLQQCQYEFQNPDILTFARFNLRDFEMQFPRGEQLEEARAVVAQMREIYAGGFYETGRFYERTSKPSASVLYYKKTIAEFPTTGVAQRCRQRLAILSPEALQEIDADNA